jgi:hypothetical protein
MDFWHGRHATRRSTLDSYDRPPRGHALKPGSETASNHVQKGTDTWKLRFSRLKEQPAAAEAGLAPESTPWHAKTRPSFADMLAAPRRVLWRRRISPKSVFSARVQETLDTVACALFAAA